MTQPNQSELDLKSKVFNALEVFELNESSRTPNGVKFWQDMKKVIEAYAAERERMARVKELERIIRGYHSVDHLMDEQELKERIAELTKAKEQPDER